MGRNKRESEDYRIEAQKAKYTKTTIKKKEKLIDLVLNQSCSIYRACKVLKMSNSTGKSVLSSFQKFGVVLSRSSSVEFEKIHTFEESKKTDEPILVKEQPINESVPHEIGEEQRVRILQNMGLAHTIFPFADYQMPAYNFFKM